MSEIFSDVWNYHAPLKQKSVRGNYALFMTRELSKAIMTKSQIKNSYVKWPSRENFTAYNKAKNKYNSLTRKAKRKSFKETTKNGVMSNRTFWKTVKPFLTNKGCMTNDCINSEKDGDIVRDEKVLVELFNEKNIYNCNYNLVPEGSILGPMLFNIFMNELFFCISNSELLNFADDNTISAAENAIEELIST